jgi:hypothetical protein
MHFRSSERRESRSSRPAFSAKATSISSSTQAPRLLPLPEDDVPGDPPAPGLEVSAGDELVDLLQDHHRDFLEDILGEVRIADEGTDVGDQP